jgi:hypothetical protein
MRLVQDGKLTPDDAAELIEAFTESEESGMDMDEPEAAAHVEEPAKASATATEAPPHAETKTTSAPQDSFRSFISQVEKMGRDVATNIDWQDIASQVKTGVGKGVDAIKEAAEKAGVNSGSFGNLFGVSEGRLVELPLQIPEGKLLRIESAAGDVKVHGGHDLGSLKANASFRAYNAEEARKKAAAYSPVIEENEQFILVKLNEGPDSKVDAEFFVGTNTPIDIRSQSGKIEVTGINAPVKINGSSGEVALAEIKGPIEASISSGSVSVTNAEGTLVNVDTKSGSVKLSGVSGAISVRTSSGDVSMTSVSGRTISVEAASGDISADLCEAVTGTINMRTVSGDINVEICDGSDVRVSLVTIQGSVSSAVELEDMTQEHLKIRGRLGDGAGLIDLSAVSGDVRLGWRNSEV